MDKKVLELVKSQVHSALYFKEGLGYRQSDKQSFSTEIEKFSFPEYQYQGNDGLRTTPAITNLHLRTFFKGCDRFTKKFMTNKSFK